MSSVLVNQQQTIEIEDGKTTLATLVTTIASGDDIAVAVNNHIITKEKWSEHLLCDNDNINIFGAIAGG
ncbi:MAG: sulfur carrier protein ThiS [Gammaproteobacteria bacterium]|nr:sulfur carrier protein ThiS [Gammaproteobacteria bacterium]